MELEPPRGAAHRDRPPAADGRARGRARVPADAAAASGRGRPRAAARGRVRARRTALFPGHAPQPGRPRLPRLLRRDRSVRRLGPSNDARGRAARGLPLHVAGRSRGAGSPTARRKPGDGRRRGVARHDLSHSRRPRSRSSPADLRPRAGRPAEAHRAACGASGARGRGPRRGRARRLELRCSRQGAVPGLAELGPLEEAGPDGQRLVRLEGQLQRDQLPEEADARLHRARAVSLGLLAGDDARLVRQGPLARRAALGRPDPALGREHESGCCVRPVDAPRLRDRTGATGARRRSTWRRSATPTW